MHTRTEFNHWFRDGSIDLQEYDECRLEDFMNGAISKDEFFHFIDQGGPTLSTQDANQNLLSRREPTEGSKRLFFISFGQLWCGKMRPENVLNSVSGGVYVIKTSYTLICSTLHQSHPKCQKSYSKSISTLCTDHSPKIFRANGGVSQNEDFSEGIIQ
jgi:hypothetical protein